MINTTCSKCEALEAFEKAFDVKVTVCYSSNFAIDLTPPLGWISVRDKKGNAAYISFNEKGLTESGISRGNGLEREVQKFKTD